jgi:hypothetical protein
MRPFRLGYQAQRIAKTALILAQSSLILDAPSRDLLTRKLTGKIIQLTALVLLKILPKRRLPPTFLDQNR